MQTKPTQSTEARRSAEIMTKPAFISVVVPIRNEEKFIAMTLNGLLGQDYPPDAFEVLVVDGDSTDASRKVVDDYVQDHEHVQLLHNPRVWSSAARNIGIENAQGEIVIIVDGHCQFVDDQYLQNVARAFQRTDIDCLGRAQPLDVTGGTPLQRAIAIARSSRLGHHPDSFIYSDQEQTVPAHSVAVAYRKSVFERIGNFDESFDACEDVELNHRIDLLGLKCLLTPSIQLKYHPRSSLGGLFRQMNRYGRGRVRLLRKHKDTFSLKSLAPAALLAGVVLGGVAAIFIPVLQIPYLLVVGTYLAIVFGFAISSAIAARTLSFLWLVPMVVFAIHFGAGYGLLKELVLGKAASPVATGENGDRR